MGNFISGRKIEEGFLPIVILAVIILVLGILFAFYPNFFRDIYTPRQSSIYCELRKDDLCEGKIVELEGKVLAGSFLSGFGYRFTPQDKKIDNEIYISAVRDGGVRFGGGG